MPAINQLAIGNRVLGDIPVVLSFLVLTVRSMELRGDSAVATWRQRSELLLRTPDKKRGWIIAIWP